MHTPAEMDTFKKLKLHHFLNLHKTAEIVYCDFTGIYENESQGRVNNSSRK